MISGRFVRFNDHTKCIRIFNHIPMLANFYPHANQQIEKAVRLVAERPIPQKGVETIAVKMDTHLYWVENSGARNIQCLLAEFEFYVQLFRTKRNSFQWNSILKYVALGLKLGTQIPNVVGAKFNAKRMRISFFDNLT